MALIICGVPRSGTTLMQRVCNAHPEIAMPYEMRFFAIRSQSYWMHARNFAGNTWRRSWAGWRAGYQPDLWARLSLGARYLRAMYRSRSVPIDAGVREDALRRVFPGARVVGDKYPGYVFELERYAVEDRLSCLVVYRDARDVASSTLRAARTIWKGQPFVANIDSVEKIASRWVYGIEKMQEQGDAIRTMRYEDLVASPRTVLAGLGDWLGVDPDGFPAEQVRGTSVGKYRNGLTEEELDIVTDTAGAKLAELGYD